mmetsp:Transcript_16075/g.32517  ORF Transcript_16075/g.32517 Transcript_16075/m.32517 type:complete len:101 (+) Transcript_16075:3-305(+)
MNQMAELVFKIGKKTLPIKHIPGPEGVRGRNSDNTLIKEVLGWAPSTTLEEGLGYTHAWISSQIKEFETAGKSLDTLTTSKICTQQMATECDMTHANEAQ